MIRSINHSALLASVPGCRDCPAGRDLLSAIDGGLGPCSDCPVARDALLDFRVAAALIDKNPEKAVRIFQTARRVLERRDYLTAFRLRRRLERAVYLEIEAPGRPARRRHLDLRWRDTDKLAQRARQDAFENWPEAAFEDIAVRFRAHQS